MFKVDISALVGRRYTTKSGATCFLRRIGPGALRAEWGSSPDSEADRREVEQWIVSFLKTIHGAEIDATVCEDQTREAELLREWEKL